MGLLSCAMLRFNSDAEILAALGLAVRAERARRRWRQVDLANEAGLAPRTVHRLEAGEPVGTDNLLCALRPLGMLDRLEAVIQPSLAPPLAPLVEAPEPDPWPPTRVRVRAARRDDGHRDALPGGAAPPDARTAEAMLLARCAAVARGEGATAPDARSANVFRLASSLLPPRRRAEAARLAGAADAFFATLPAAACSTADIVRQGWVVSLPRFRQQLQGVLP